MIDNSFIPSAVLHGSSCEKASGSQLKPLRIGLFDSGVGGLSVLRALQREMPQLDYVYCGDTARLPYGKRNPKVIENYSMQASRFLVDSGADIIVIACNTASSVALNTVQQHFPDILIRGVVEAGAQAAMEATCNGRIAVIGTECTVAARAYEKAIGLLLPTAEVRSQACPFLVSLAEEGWIDCDIAVSVVKKYLEPLFNQFASNKPDTLVLGCTHFSQFASIIRKEVGTEVTIVNPADNLARDLSLLPTVQQLFDKERSGSMMFHATHALQRFARVGELFLGTQIPQDSLQRITLDNH